MLNTKSMTVEEIREYIISNHSVDRATLLNIKGKGNLVNFLNSLDKVESEIPDLKEEKDAVPMESDIEDVSEFQITFENEVKEEKAAESAPSKYDPEWTEYVISQLTDVEKDKEYPKADGLRRLVEKLICPIEKMYTTVVQSPSRDNGMISTVKTTVVLENGQSYEAVTDVQKEHLQHPFDKHISAIAETRAEGRAYRKILRLQNIVTKEEMVADTNLDDTKMAKTQIAYIDAMCNNGRLNINVKKLFDYVFKEKKLVDVKEYAHADVASVCAMLSEYQSDMSKIPTEVQGYTSTWKD